MSQREEVREKNSAGHAQSKSWEKTDWAQIVALYGLLHSFQPSPVVRINQAMQFPTPKRLKTGCRCSKRLPQTGNWMATNYIRGQGGFVHSIKEIERSKGRFGKGNWADRQPTGKVFPVG